MSTDKTKSAIRIKFSSSSNYGNLIKMFIKGLVGANIVARLIRWLRKALKHKLGLCPGADRGSLPSHSGLGCGQTSDPYPKIKIFV